MKVIVYKDEAGEFHWKILAENGEIIFVLPRATTTRVTRSPWLRS
jgi:hypothetical protein